MNTELGKHDDGMIGLGVLAMLTVALIAGQFHSSVESSASLAPTTHSPVFSEAMQDPSTRLDGAIRELRIVPSLINSAVDLGWSSDEELIDGYRKTGF